MYLRGLRCRRRSTRPPSKGMTDARARNAIHCHTPRPPQRTPSKAPGGAGPTARDGLGPRLQLGPAGHHSLDPLARLAHGACSPGGRGSSISSEEKTGRFSLVKEAGVKAKPRGRQTWSFPPGFVGTFSQAHIWKRFPAFIQSTSGWIGGTCPHSFSPCFFERCSAKVSGQEETTFRSFVMWPEVSPPLPTA